VITTPPNAMTGAALHAAEHGKLAVYIQVHYSCDGVSGVSALNARSHGGNDMLQSKRPLSADLNAVQTLTRGTACAVSCIWLFCRHCSRSSSNTKQQLHRHHGVVDARSWRESSSYGLQQVPFVSPAGNFTMKNAFRDEVEHQYNYLYEPANRCVCVCVCVCSGRDRSLDLALHVRRTKKKTTDQARNA